jgi:hypothetical protein
MVNYIERKCNIQELQLSLIAYNHNSISVLLQGIMLVVTSWLIFWSSLAGVLITFSDSSSVIFVVYFLFVYYWYSSFMFVTNELMKMI